jgi:protein-S-isoprenylcysteine O-methyltransferase Ste14
MAPPRRNHMQHFLSIYSSITLALWAVLVVYLMGGARTANRGLSAAQPGSGWMRAFKAAAMLYVLAVIYFPGEIGIHTPAVVTPDWEGSAGVLLCAAGVALVIAARRALGPNWSDLVVLKRNHQLVRSGPYRWIRHPLYSGVLLAVLGSAITVATRIAYLTVPVLLMGFAVKSRQEENLLERSFPEYGVYRRRVKGFIPLLF